MEKTSGVYELRRVDTEADSGGIVRTALYRQQNGGFMSWGDLVRRKMKNDVELKMKIRRIRRAWYHFTDDSPQNLMGLACLLMALGVCVGGWYEFNTILGWFRIR